MARRILSVRTVTARVSSLRTSPREESSVGSPDSQLSPWRLLGMLLTAVPTSPLCLLFLTFKSENKAVLLSTFLHYRHSGEILCYGAVLCIEKMFMSSILASLMPLASPHSFGETTKHRPVSPRGGGRRRIPPDGKPLGQAKQHRQEEDRMSCDSAGFTSPDSEEPEGKSKPRKERS